MEWYLLDIKILLGSVLHHKVHSYTQFFLSVPKDSQQHHIIAFATSLPHSLLKSETIPEIISVSNTSTHLKFWWQKHQTMAFVQGSGTATLSPLNNIFFEESSRPNHKGWWPRLQKCNRTLPSGGWQDFSKHVWTTQCGFHPRNSQASCAKRTIVNHAITVFCSHLINFISCINHDSLTFIVEPMSWSCGLGDSSRGDKCCYLLRARINSVFRKTGRVEKKGKKLDTEHKSSKEVAVQQQMLDWADQWVLNGGWFISTMCSINHFLNVTLVFPVSIFSVFLMRIIESGSLENVFF